MPNQDSPDPNKAIVIIDELGDIYMLASNVWQKAAEKITDPGRALLPNQVRQSGGLVSFVGRDLVGPGIGAECTIVNLQAILRNVLGRQVSAPVPASPSPVAALGSGPETPTTSYGTGSQTSGAGMTAGDAAGRTSTKGG